MQGTGTFVRGDGRTPFAPGDALFVAAGIELFPMISQPGGVLRTGGEPE